MKKCVFHFLYKTNKDSRSDLLNIVHKDRKRCFGASLKKTFIKKFCDKWIILIYCKWKFINKKFGSSCKHEVFLNLNHEQCKNHAVNENLLRYINAVRVCFDYKRRYLNYKIISFVFDVGIRYLPFHCSKKNKIIITRSTNTHLQLLILICNFLVHPICKGNKKDLLFLTPISKTPLLSLNWMNIRYVQYIFRRYWKLNKCNNTSNHIIFLAG